MFYVYILYSVRSDRYYIGQSEDVFKRLYEHNHPLRNSKYCSKHIPWKLVLNFEVSSSRSDAMMVERFIKKQKSRIFIEKLIRESSNRQYYTEFINKIIEGGKLVRAIPSPRD
jgi:putative endonuclease